MYRLEEDKFFFLSQNNPLLQGLQILFSRVEYNCAANKQSIQVLAVVHVHLQAAA